MRIAGLGAMRALAVAVLLVASPAAAFCPATGFDTTGLVPADGTAGVALDSAVVIPVIPDPQFAAACWDGDWFASPVWSLSVTPKGGSPIAGTSARFNHASHCSLGGPEVVAWRPDLPLSPQTQYELVAAFQDPPSASSFQLVTSFTTGTELLAPMTFSGTLDVTTFVGTRQRKLCMQPDQCGGGGGCTTTTYQAVIAAVGGIEITGGQEASGYDVAVTVGVDVPASSWPGWQLGNHVASGAPVQLETEIADVGHPYAPCFAVSARDATGRQVTSKPLCLDKMDPGALVAAGESPDAGGGAPNPADGGAPNPADGGARSPADGCACRLATGASQRSTWGLLTLALLLARRRTRDSRNTRAV